MSEDLFNGHAHAKTMGGRKKRTARQAERPRPGPQESAGAEEAPQDAGAATGGAVLEYKGIAIRDRDGKLNMTDMWRAAGSPAGKDPAQWRRLPGTEVFASFVADNLNMGKSHVEVFQVDRGGREPATWAHWQLGIAYAKYLSPAFHAWANQVVRDRMEGKLGTVEELMRMVASAPTKAELGRQVAAIVAEKTAPVLAQLEALKGQLDKVRELVPGLHRQPDLVTTREWITAKAIAVRYGVMERTRGCVQRIGNSVADFCLRRSDLPRERPADPWMPRLFHVDAVAAWHEAGGHELIRREKGKADGQSVMKMG